jgi:hypothetical protein
MSEYHGEKISSANCKIKVKYSRYNDRRYVLFQRQACNLFPATLHCQIGSKSKNKLTKAFLDLLHHEGNLIL